MRPLPVPPPVFRSLANSIKEGVLIPTIYGCNKLIEFFSVCGSPEFACKLFDEMPHRNVFTWNTMIHAHILHGDMDAARQVFDSAPTRDLVTYNSMISGNSRASWEHEAVELFYEMRRAGFRADPFALTAMLTVASGTHDPAFGRQVHACIIKTADDHDRFAVSSAIDMYSKCGCFADAVRVFGAAFRDAVEADTVSRNAMLAACCREGKIDMAAELFSSASTIDDVMSWNTLISGYVQNDHPGAAMDLFLRMSHAGVECNEHTIASLLAACASMRSLEHGREIHGWILRRGHESNPFISSCIVDLYCKCDKLDHAWTVHSRHCDGNVFSTTSLIVGYSQQLQMGEAKRLFDSVGDRNLNPVIWTALFVGYIRASAYGEVLELFSEAALRRRDVAVLDAVVLISVLVACSALTDLEHGRQLHCYITRMGVGLDGKLSTALVDMYSKCGAVGSAGLIFRHTTDRDRVAYNAMMSGYANNGFAMKAIELFAEMGRAGLRPDAITFIAVLSACRHAGLVEMGEFFFHSMSVKHGIPPEIDHYSCMIDLLGRANRLGKAAALLESMPFEAEDVTLGTFLNACRVGGNTELARVAEERLLKIGASDDCSRCVQLANVFAAEGEWSEVERIRRKMRGGEMKKHAGCSWVQVGGKVNTFVSGDVVHPEIGRTSEMLGRLYGEIMDSDEVSCDDIVYVNEW